MSSETVTISQAAYERLCQWKRDYDLLRAERLNELEAWNEIYERRGEGNCFVLRTIDGLLCYVPPASKFAHVKKRPDGLRELFRSERTLEEDRIDSDPGKLITRRLRYYVETPETIRGVPVFQEQPFQP